MRKRKRAQQTAKGAAGTKPPISVPYFAPRPSLPATLPTTADILSTQEILSKTTSTNVVAVGLHFVAKYGKHVDLEEGRTMKYVEDRTTVPVPPSLRPLS